MRYYYWFERHKVVLAVGAIVLVFAMVFFVPWLMMKIRHGADAFSYDTVTTTSSNSGITTLPALIPATLTGTTTLASALTGTTLPATLPPTEQTTAAATTVFVPNAYGYVLVVYKGNQTVGAYALTQDGIYNPNAPVKLMLCSTASTDEKTPNGSYKVSNKYDYRSLVGGRVQYCTRFEENMMFQSVPMISSAMTQEDGVSQMLISEYQKLGQAVTDGDVRLCAGDAKWIYDYCDLNTSVIVTSRSCPTGEGQTPLTLLEGEPYQKDGLGWDPTDPNARNPYAAVYNISQTTAAIVTVPVSTAPVTTTATTPFVPTTAPNQTTAAVDTNNLQNLINNNQTNSNTESLSLWTHELKLKVGNVVGLNVSVMPEGADAGDLQWYVDGEAIYFGNNTIVALQPGHSSIVVMCKGIIDTCTVTVIQ